jgi:hypothetical protein
MRTEEIAMARIGMDKSRWRLDAKLYQDDETGLPLALGPFTINPYRKGVGYPVLDEDGKAITEPFPDKFTAYRRMLDIYEEWWRALPVQQVYFIGTAAELTARVKIGTARSVPSRLRQLQVGCPDVLRILATVEGDRMTEARYHEKFKRQRRHGEWFVINQAILSEIERLSTPARGGGIV